MEYRPEFVGLSALMTMGLPEMKNVINALTEASLRDGMRIIIGGPPTSNEFAKEIGADGYGRDAQDGFKLLESWLK